MCNCKGWDIAYYSDHITIEQHFCRDLDDCGHVDNTLEEAADAVVAAYDKEFQYMQSLAKDPNYSFLYDTERLMEIVSLSQQWKERTHPDYIYYKKGK